MNKSNMLSPEVRERAVRWCKSTEGVPVTVGGSRIDRTEDRLRAADLA